MWIIDHYYKLQQTVFSGETLSKTQTPARDGTLNPYQILFRGTISIQVHYVYVPTYLLSTRCRVYVFRIAENSRDLLGTFYDLTICLAGSCRKETGKTLRIFSVFARGVYRCGIFQDKFDIGHCPNNLRLHHRIQYFITAPRFYFPYRKDGPTLLLFFFLAC